MPSYKTLIVLGLVASNVSPALSAPIRRVREQSLSHRGLGPAVEGAAAKKSWGPALKKYGKEFLIGTGATMAFAYAFEKLNGSGKSSSTPSTASATPDGSNTPNPNSANTPNTGYTGDTGDTGYTGYTGNTGYTGYTGNTGNTGYTPNNDNIVYTPNTANNANNQVSSTYSPSNFPTYSSSNYPTDPSSTNAGYPTSTNTGYSTSTNPTAQTQNGYQQRAVDRDLPVDIFEARSTSDNTNQNRQTASLGPLGRADVVDAIRLFSRMLDELD